MSFEPTSKGNEFDLTVKQHFHMKAILRKFAGEDNKVAVTDKETGVSARFGVMNKRFIASRAWSQELEKHISWPIEKAFILEIKRVEGRGLVEEHEAISMYHLLWSLRHMFALNPSAERTLIPDMTGQMDKRLEEFAESLGKLPLNGGVAASRFATALDIKYLLGHSVNLGNYNGIFWQVLRSKTTRFISADSYQSRLLIPVSPHILLKGCRDPEKPLTLDVSQVEIFNKMAYEEAKNFTFG